MKTESDSAHPDWELLLPERLPRPNYFPAGLAMGTAFLFWGFVTSGVILAVGGGLFVASLAGWINEMRRKQKHD
jgi:hypothetical protein